MESEAKKKFDYFERLENIIKKGCAAYVLIFIIGVVMIITGPAAFFGTASQHTFPFLGAALIILSAAFFGLYFVIARLGWLGELHVRLDKLFLGFLLRSNAVIYSTLISALPEEEAAIAQRFSSDIKEKLAQSIFSRVSGDNRLFNVLLESNLFRFWMRYWILLYGILTFTLLTVVSFVAAVIRNDFADKAFFLLNWVFAIGHIGLSFLLGKYLITMTIDNVQHIVSTHKDTIAQLVRVYLPRESIAGESDQDDASFEEL